MFRKWISNLKSFLSKRNMFFAFLLLLILGFYFGYFLMDIMDKKNQINALDNKKSDVSISKIDYNNGKKIVANALDDNIVTSETKVVFIIKYLKSHDENKEVLPAQEEIIGFDERKVKNFFKQWEITSFNSNEIVLVRSIDSFSPKHFKVGIGKNNGEDCIAIYKFNKDGQEIVDFITNTPISILNQKEKEKFIKGMIFNNEEELHRMLENYDL